MSRNDRYRGKQKVMGTEGAWYRAMTGNRSKEVTDQRRVKDLVKAHTPRVSKRREGAPRNAAEARRQGERAAAERLGVSVRTLQSWSNKKRAPNKANLAKVRDAHNTREVRAATTPKRRRNRFAGGLKVNVTANQGPNDRTYYRVRNIADTFDPDAAERIMDAFVEGGPEQAQRQLLEEINAAEGYAGSEGLDWGMEDITKFEFKESNTETDSFDE